MNPQKTKQQKKHRRKARTRAKVFGTAKIPRLSVFRSLKHISAQLIDDEKGRTLVAVNDISLKHKNIKTLKQDEKEIKKLRNKEIDGRIKNISTKIATAFEVGKLLAEKSLAKKIKKCVFDKGGYKYHGRVKAVAEGAREGGLKF